MMTNNGKTITISIDPVGKATVEANGFQGQGCEQATDAIEKALAGGSGVTRVMKDEWMQNEDQDQEQHMVTGRL